MIVIYYSMLYVAFCYQASLTWAFLDSGVSGLKTINPYFVRNKYLLHGMAVDGKDTPQKVPSPRRLFMKQCVVNVALNALVTQPLVTRPCLADIEGVVTPSFADPAPLLSSPKDLVDKGLIPIFSDNSSRSSDIILYTSKSGLKYIDLQEGEGFSPRYGQLCSISYSAYVKLPDDNDLKENLQKYDSSDAFLLKHGNGRMIPGIDEGIHTMKIGGKRRLIIPPKLGYIGPGVLGPLPSTPIGRYKLNRLLEEMIARRGGNIVVDVTLRAVFDDEADQGYYQDDSLSPDDFDTLKTNLQMKVASARNSSLRESSDE